MKSSKQEKTKVKKMVSKTLFKFVETYLFRMIKMKEIRCNEEYMPNMRLQLHICLLYKCVLLIVVVRPELFLKIVDYLLVHLEGLG